MYQIATFLTETQRRSAVDSEYEEGTDHWGFCPLGNALRKHTGKWFDSILYTPSSGTVSASLYDSQPELLPDDHIIVKEAAQEFIRDWDSGKIVDLYEAFGL